MPTGDQIPDTTYSGGLVDDNQDHVSYRFPVEVEVVGELGDEHAHQLSQYVFERLDQTLRSRG